MSASPESVFCMHGLVGSSQTRVPACLLLLTPLQKVLHFFWVQWKTHKVQPKRSPKATPLRKPQPTKPPKTKTAKLLFFFLGGGELKNPQKQQIQKGWFPSKRLKKTVWCGGLVVWFGAKPSKKPNPLFFWGGDLRNKN